MKKKATIGRKFIKPSYSYLIEKKRDGGEFTQEEIRYAIDSMLDGEMPKFQLAALAMAIYFQGMSAQETATLTEEMMLSGEVIDLSRLSKPKIDKYSTGGVGDKTSMVLVPLAAASGVVVGEQGCDHRRWRHALLLCVGGRPVRRSSCRAAQGTRPSPQPGTGAGASICTSLTRRRSRTAIETAGEDHHVGAATSAAADGVVPSRDPHRRRVAPQPCQASSSVSTGPGCGRSGTHPPAVFTCDRPAYHSPVAYHRGVLEVLMAGVNTQVQLDERLLERLEQRANASGRNRDQIIEDALRRQLDDDDLQDVFANVRERSDLTDEQALESAYSELKAMRAERRAAS